MNASVHHRSLGLARYFAALLVAFVASGTEFAYAGEPPIILPACFADNMVLLRPRVDGNLPLIWGWAERGLKVWVSIGGTNLHAEKWEQVAGYDSLQPWVVYYKILGTNHPAPKNPFTISIRCSKSGKFDEKIPVGVSLTNVVFGEVWLVIDPHSGAPPEPLASDPRSRSSDVRVLRLNHYIDKTLRPERAQSIADGSWRRLNDPQTQFSGASAISAYWLASQCSHPLPDSWPVGVLLLSSTNIGPIAQSGYENLSQNYQRSPYFKIPFAAWKSSWDRARSGVGEAQKEYDRDRVLLKRRGQIMTNSLPASVREEPSIRDGTPQGLFFAIRGFLY